MNKKINSTGTLPHTGYMASGLLTGGPAREKGRERERGREGGREGGRERKKGAQISYMMITEEIMTQTNSTGIHKSERGNGLMSKQ